MSNGQGREETERLERLYEGMGDAELVQLASTPGDLTGTAREALAAELRRRALDVPAGAEQDVAGGDVGLPTAGDVMPSNLGATGPEIELTMFYDAMSAGRACEFLGEAGVPFHLADLAEASGLGTLEGGPAVALRVTVPLADLERAQSVLRRTMGLFPLQEVEASDEAEDDGTLATLGVCATRDEAEEIAAVVERAGIWAAVVENEGDAENPFAVEVREVDLFRAGDAVEKSLL